MIGGYRGWRGLNGQQHRSKRGPTIKGGAARSLRSLRRRWSKWCGRRRRSSCGKANPPPPPPAALRRKKVPPPPPGRPPLASARGAPLKSRLRHYSRLDRMAGKLRDLVHEFRWGRMDELAAQEANRISRPSVSGSRR